MQVHFVSIRKAGDPASHIRKFGNPDETSCFDRRLLLGFELRDVRVMTLNSLIGFPFYYGNGERIQREKPSDGRAS